MTIEEAIQYLENDLASDTGYLCQQTRDAIRLGIEALKAVKKIRSVGFWSADGSLPEETKK